MGLLKVFTVLSVASLAGLGCKSAPGYGDGAMAQGSDMSQPTPCPTFKVNTTTDGTQACSNTVCQPGEHCSNITCMKGCLTENNCTKGQYCDLSNPTSDPFINKMVGTCQTPVACAAMDMSMSGVQPDLAASQPCGSSGAACCVTGSPCGAGLMCYPGANLCGPPCGVENNPCCPTGTACTGQLVCDHKTCVPCGKAFGDPCCAMAPACGAGLGCGVGSTCEPCGEFGQVCCSAMPPCNGMGTCMANNTCQ